MKEQCEKSSVRLDRRQLRYEETTTPVKRTSEREYKIRKIVGKEAMDRDRNKRSQTGARHSASPQEVMPCRPEGAIPSKQAMPDREVQTTKGTPTCVRCSASASTFRTCMQRAHGRTAVRYIVRRQTQDLFSVRARQCIDTTS